MKTRQWRMLACDAIPFGRSRHRAYTELTRALTRVERVADREEDDRAKETGTSAQQLSCTPTSDRRCVSYELQLLKKEIARVQSTLRELKKKRSDSSTDVGERNSWRVAERSRAKSNTLARTTRTSHTWARKSQHLMTHKAPEPSTRGMAVILTQRLEEVLPEGSIEQKHRTIRQVGAISDALMHSSSTHIDSFGDEFRVLDVALCEGARQVGAECKERGELLDIIRERYGELFSAMRSVCDRWHRRNEKLMIELRELKLALDAKESRHVALVAYLSLIHI